MIEYQVTLLSFSQQTLGIKVLVPALAETITVSLPAWIPGSYMIRDFARNLGEFEARTQSGDTLKWEKKDKQTWTIAADNQPCEISYTVVANDFSVRGAFINHDYAFMNGTSVFVGIAQAQRDECQVVVNSASAPAHWQPYSAMAVSGESTFTADSYRSLIDHPIYWGNAQVASFQVQDVEFQFLLSGNQPIDIGRITDDLVPICEHHLNLFPGPSPVQRYLFITLLADKGYGGLEHRESTVLMYPRFELPLTGETTPPKEGYTDYLSLCSHELFHTWHVKRLRPKVMLAPDLSKEVYTEQLWIYEGITSFYDDLAVARAQKMSPEQYLTIVGKHLTRLYHSPGRDKQTVAESSFDAWTRFYKQDAHSNNHIVSYYTKGGIIAMGLDLLLRQKSDGKVTMDDVMSHLWSEYGVNESGTPDDVISLTCKALGVDVDDYLNEVTFDTRDVDLASLLPTIGLTLKFRNRQQSSDKGGAASETTTEKDLGAQLSKNGMGLKVTQIQQGGNAEKANLMIDDIIIAVDNWIADEALLMRMLQGAESASALSLTVARQGQLITLSLPAGPGQQNVAYLEITDRDKYLAWLG